MRKRIRHYVVYTPPKLREVLLSLARTRTKMERRLLCGSLPWDGSGAQIAKAKRELMPWLQLMGVRFQAGNTATRHIVISSDGLFKLEMRMAQEYLDRRGDGQGK